MKNLKALLLEDNEYDYELIANELQKIPECRWEIRWVKNREEFCSGLRNFRPDLVLSDFNLGQYNGMEALNDTLVFDPLLPFIIVTGTLSEETAADSIKSGAWDYVIKQRLHRLSSSVTNALKLRDEKLRNVAAEEILRASEEKFSKIFQFTPDGILLTDIETGYVIDANESTLAISGYSRNEFINNFTSALNMWEKPGDREKFVEELQKTGKVVNMVANFRKKDGKLLNCLISGELIEVNHRKVILAIVRDFTEIIKAEKSLQDSERKFRELVENLGEGIGIADSSEVFLFANPALEEIFGVRSGGLIGRKLNEFTTDDFTEILKAENDRRRKGEKSTYEIMITLDDNQQRWLTLTAVPWQDENGKHQGSIGIFRNDTERKQIMADLLAAKEKAENSERDLMLRNKIANIFLTSSEHELFNNVLKVILEELHSKYGLFGFVENESVLTLASITDKIWNQCQVQGKTLSFPRESWAGSWGRCLRERRPVIVNADLHVPEGHVQVKNALNVPVIHDQRLIGLLTVSDKDGGYNLQDQEKLMIIANKLAPVLWAILEKNRKEEERRLANEQLLVEKQKAEESDRLKTAFLSNISHEIRTPLNGILGFAEMLTEPGLDETQRKYYSDILRISSKQLLSIIEDILEISRLESSHVELNLEDTKPREMILELYEANHQRTASSGVQLIPSISREDDDRTYKTDRKKLTQVMRYLLDNAIKFTHHGSIEFGYRIDDDNLMFFVKDTGIGIPPELHEKIFDRFRQAELTFTRQYGGTGLGLSICKRLVELMKGKLILVSEPGQGSEFSFIIPGCISTDDTTEEPARPVGDSKIEQTLSDNRDKPLIIIAEDEELNMIFLDRILQLNGYNVVKARNGSEAIGQLRNNPTASLVLMDLKMPVMNGIEATQQIKLMNPSLPVIAQSAFVTTEDRLQAFEAGCDDFISKPVKKSELLEKIQHLLNKKL